MIFLWGKCAVSNQRVPYDVSQIYEDLVGVENISIFVGSFGEWSWTKAKSQLTAVLNKFPDV